LTEELDCAPDAGAFPLPFGRDYHGVGTRQRTVHRAGDTVTHDGPKATEESFYIEFLWDVIVMRAQLAKFTGSGSIPNLDGINGALALRLHGLFRLGLRAANLNF
jgi:hypothetical protein